MSEPKETAVEIVIMRPLEWHVAALCLQCFALGIIVAFCIIVVIGNRNTERNIRDLDARIELQQARLQAIGS